MTTVPLPQPGRFESNELTGWLKSVCAVMRTENAPGAADAAGAVKTATAVAAVARAPNSAERAGRIIGSTPSPWTVGTTPENRREDHGGGQIPPARMGRQAE